MKPCSKLTQLTGIVAIEDGFTEHVQNTEETIYVHDVVGSGDDEHGLIICNLALLHHLHVNQFELYN
jgi:hypothetical protein